MMSEEELCPGYFCPSDGRGALCPARLCPGSDISGGVCSEGVLSYTLKNACTRCSAAASGWQIGNKSIPGRNEG